MEFNELMKQATRIREQYHRLEVENHGTKWSLEEDALAFLSDAGLVGRLVMDHEQRWSKVNSDGQLEHKIAECIWWLMIIAERSNIQLEDEVPHLFNRLEELTK